MAEVNDIERPLEDQDADAQNLDAVEDTADDDIHPLPTAEDAVEARVKEMIEELEAEYSAENVTELLVEAAYNDEVAEFLLAAEAHITETIREVGKKVRFHLHPEANGDLYILRTIKHNEWNSAWMRILTGQPEEFAKHGDAMLQLVMVYPSFEETDWDWSGEGINTPEGMVRQRLVGTIFDAEMAQAQAEPVSFGTDELPNVTKAARKRKEKPGF